MLLIIIVPREFSIQMDWALSKSQMESFLNIIKKTLRHYLFINALDDEACNLKTTLSVTKQPKAIQIF